MRKENHINVYHSSIDLLYIFEPSEEMEIEFFEEYRDGLWEIEIEPSEIKKVVLKYIEEDFGFNYGEIETIQKMFNRMGDDMWEQVIMYYEDSLLNDYEDFAYETFVCDGWRKGE